MNPAIAAMSTNLAVNNKFIVTIPVDKLFPGVYTKNNFTFNLFSFELPEIELGSEEVQFHGSPLDIPNGTRRYTKEINFSYILSSDWNQYGFLYRWSLMFANEYGSGAEETVLEKKTVPVRFVVLSEFKNPIFEVVYYDAWLKRLGGISMTYQDDAPVVVHTFSLKYTYFKVNDGISITNG
ncbi:MAG TPA: hypothetical protein PLA71_00765 [Saccharofermentans sp.]|nr:hypothetical protein [Saccharofermentans sp.]